MNTPSFGGISGGRTSGLMHALMAGQPGYVPHFENTGREHPKTLEFLNELDLATGQRIVWLEFRPPRTKGVRPREFEFAQVTFKTADRSGGPFEAYLEAHAEFRRTLGKPPVTPWAKGRTCTGYVKHKVMEHYITSLGIDTFDSYVGLRFDEPNRVFRIRERDTQRRTHRTPLFHAGVAESDVMEFWAEQPFDLEIPSELGNCTGCFLKDHSEISRLLGDENTDAAWWLRIEQKYPRFGGDSFPGYAELLRQRPVRLAIEAALRAGQTPVSDGTLEPRRFRLTMLDEKRRLASGPRGISCACEASNLPDDEDEAA